MKVTYEQIMNAAPHTVSVSTLTLPILSSLQVALLLMEIDKHAKLFIEARDKIVEKYNSLPDGERTDEVRADLNAQILNALKAEVDVNYEPIDISAILSSVDVATMYNTAWMWKMDS